MVHTRGCLLPTFFLGRYGRGERGVEFNCGTVVVVVVTQKWDYYNFSPTLTSFYPPLRNLSHKEQRKRSWHNEKISTTVQCTLNGLLIENTVLGKIFIYEFLGTNLDICKRAN